jgi:hypothetical protein
MITGEQPFPMADGRLLSIFVSETITEFITAKVLRGNEINC